MFKQYNGGVSNFDPENFDPAMAQRYNSATGNEAGSVTVAATPGQQMQVNLTLNNPTASALTFELWNYIDSMTKYKKGAYATGAFLYIPGDSIEGITRQAADTGGCVGWNENGDLIIQGANRAAAHGSISCGEIPYRSFFDASGITPFKVSFIRYTCSTANQIDKQITHFVKSYSGGTKENKISPRAYFKPSQFQDLTIDITVSFTIGIDSGLRHELLAGESVRMSLFIELWTNQTLG